MVGVEDGGGCLRQKKYIEIAHYCTNPDCGTVHRPSDSKEYFADLLWLFRFVYREAQYDEECIAFCRIGSCKVMIVAFGAASIAVSGVFRRTLCGKSKISNFSIESIELK